MSKDDEAPDEGKKSVSWPDFLTDLFSQPIWDGLSYLVVGVFRLAGAVVTAVLEGLPF